MPFRLKNVNCNVLKVVECQCLLEGRPGCLVGLRDTSVLPSYFCLLTLHFSASRKKFVVKTFIFSSFFSPATVVDYVEEGADDILMVCAEQKVNRPPTTHSCTVTPVTPYLMLQILGMSTRVSVTL